MSNRLKYGTFRKKLRRKSSRSMFNQGVLKLDNENMTYERKKLINVSHQT